MRKKKPAKIWHDAKIPAYLFFDILQTENLKLLIRKKGKLSKNDLEKAWASIYDEYYLLKGDRKLDLIIRTKKRILELMYKVEVVKPILYSICTVPFNEEQLNELAEKLKKVGFKLDLEDPLTSVLNILQSEIPAIETRIEIEKDNLKLLTDGEAATFEENCVAYESFGYKIDESCSLRRYVAYEKAAIKKSKSNGKRKVN